MLISLSALTFLGFGPVDYTIFTFVLCSLDPIMELQMFAHFTKKGHTKCFIPFKETFLKHTLYSF